MLKRLDKAHRVFIGPIGVNDALGLKTLCVQLTYGRMILDDFVHQWLRKAGFVALIMAKATIAPHVDHDVAVEGLAEFNRNLACECYRFGIIAIDVENRRLNTFGYVGRIRR